MKRKVIVGLTSLLSIPFGIALSYGIPSVSASTSAGTSDSQAVNHAALNAAASQQNIGEIITPEGTFLKVTTPLSSLGVASSQVAHSNEDIMTLKNYLIIVRPYGTFVLAGTPLAARLFGLSISPLSSNSLANQNSVDDTQAIDEIKQFQAAWVKSHSNK